MTRDPDGFSLMGLGTAEWLTRVNDFGHVLDLIKHPEPNRADLTYENPVDWDDEPTFYQACTIAHGHILHLKTEWVADGYSLGDLLYSLPLAPCQKKQIAILDWDRREAAARQETLQEQEFLAAQLSHDRDIYDIANGAAHGSVAGGSEASTWGVGGGFGVGLDLGFIGGSIGVGGGYSSSSSSAWQESSKSAAASSLQQIRDRVSQSALAVRNQRSTVVQTVRQGENLRVETEVVANHNHCHAVTIEYFEVLRHFLVRHRLADVQECLLVPLLMSRFDSAKARRWRDSLNRYLRNRRLGRGFDALQRIADNYVGSDMPTGAYAEEELEYLDGYLRIRFHIQRPRDNEDGSFLADAWPPIMAVFGVSPQEFYQNYLEGQRDKDQIFAEVLGPRIAEEIVNGLRFHAVLESGAERELPIDATLVSDFRNDEPLYISLRLTGELPTIRREEIKFIRVSCVITVTAISAGPLALASLLTPGSKVIVHSGQINYRTKHLAHSLFNQQRILNDLSVYDGVSIFTPLSQRELRRPREEDKEYASSLLKHLNDHIEYYHRVIWWHMDRQRRYMLLDGFIAPNSGGRSVASVVENRLVGIIGNCLVLPVARGYHLDPTYSQNADNPITLLEHYQPTTPIEPSRIAIPTKGVFAESVMGACNACEKKDESRFWRWEESPCPDQPTPIQEVSTASRRAEPPNLEAKDFPAPIVAFQNVPATPDPQGYGALLQMLSNPNLFPDVTGLTENQRNALATLQSALATSQYFGGKAADLALQSNMRQDIDKALNKINEQHQAGAITDEQRANLTEAALRSMIGGGTQTPAQPMTTDEIERLTNTAGANDADVTVSRPGGENVSVNAQQATLAEYNPPLQQQCGFFGLNTVVTETSLRDAIRFATFMEPLKWRDGTTGAVLKEDEDQQFGHLVRYWLARFEEIRPSTLTALQNKAIDPAINYGHILDPGPNNAQVVADVARVRVELLADAPGVSDPPNLNTRVEQALLSARASRKDETAWSAVFIVACIRGVAIQLGLEAEDGSNHVGQNMLLQAHEGHRFYVAEAYRRRLGPNGRTNGTYHAFQVNERAVQVGDIIVQDRDANTIANVVRFNNIPSIAIVGVVFIVTLLLK